MIKFDGMRPKDYGSVDVDLGPTGLSLTIFYPLLLGRGGGGGGAGAFIGSAYILIKIMENSFPAMVVRW
jgi:hypothetical protein